MKELDQTSRLKIIVGLILLGLFLFGPSVRHPFHFDDALITSDTNISMPSNWRHFLSPFYLRQLTFFSFYLNNLAFGFHPGSYHAVNVALHIANAGLLFVLIDGLIDRWIAAASAFIFLVHPIQTEAVLYVYQRSILLACFFSLLALIALRSHRYVLMLVLFVCAFEAKESALAIPLAIAIFYSPRWNLKGKRAGGAIGRLAIVLMVLALAGSALYLLKKAGDATVGIGALKQVSAGSYFLTETRVVYTYLRLLVFPKPQSLEYEFTWLHSLADPFVWIQLTGLVSLLAIGVFLYRKPEWRVTGFSILAFFVLLAPTSSLIPSNDAAFEHRLYLPMLAFSLFTASLAARIPRRNVMVAALVAILSILTFSRQKVWASDTALWEDAVQHAPGKARAWFNLGGAYMDRDPDKARAALQKALAIQPDFPEGWYDLGVIEGNRGNFGKASEDYREAVRVGPDYWPAWNNLGNTLFAMGQRDRAIEMFERTLRLNPDYWPAQYNIAIAQYSSGRYEEAITRLRTVLDWRPEFKEARYLLAMSLTQTGNRIEAEREWLRIGNNPAGQPPMPAMIPATTH